MEVVVGGVVKSLSYMGEIFLRDVSQPVPLFVLDVFLDGQGGVFGGGVEECGKEEVGSVFGSAGAAGLLLFLNLEFIDSLEEFLF